MTERAYTVAEVEALRHALTTKYLFGEYNPRDATTTRQLDERAIEERVRTHMLAGHTAADLYASESNAAD